MRKYPDQTAFKEETKALNRHFWYLRENLAGLVFFDYIISAVLKQKMAHTLQRNKRNKVVRQLNLTKDFKDLNLYKLVTLKKKANFQSPNER